MYDIFIINLTCQIKHKKTHDKEKKEFIKGRCKLT